MTPTYTVLFFEEQNAGKKPFAYQRAHHSLQLAMQEETKQFHKTAKNMGLPLWPLGQNNKKKTKRSSMSGYPR